MRSFHQLAFRNMRARLVRTLLTAGFVLGVAVILAVAITNQSALAAIGDLFDEASGKSQLVVQSANDMGDGFDQNLMARVAALAHSVLASEADTWQLSTTLAKVGGSELQLFGVDPQVDGEARVYQLVEGRLLRDAEEQAIVLVKEYADINGYELQFVWPVAALIEGVLVAFVVSQLAALYPAWRAADTNIVAAIQHE